MRKLSIFLCAMALSGLLSARISRAEDNGFQYPFQNYNLPVETRVADLLSRLTLQEKSQLLNAGAGEISRFGIKPYNYGSEALHGVMGPGEFTVFPQAIGMAATWDPDLIKTVSTAISDEAWGAINRESAKSGYPGERFLTFWSPTINMARDPRWGRTPETYGEDPWLTSRIAVAFVKGLQGDDPRYLKAAAAPKHFAANNEEHNRFRCDAKISERTLREYYFPGFKAAVQEGGAQSIMGAYNSINGVPSNANSWLLTKELRDEWGFDGYVVTDCDAMTFMLTQNHYAKNPVEAAAFAINAGVDVECGGDAILRNNIAEAVSKSMVSETTLDQSVARLLRVRFRLGMFDPPELNPYTRIPPSVIGSKKHQELARKVSRESIVLLKNDTRGGKPLLPIDASKIRSIAVVGPNADSVQFGDYTGKPVNDSVTTLGGVRARAGKRVDVRHAPWIPAPNDSEYAVVPADVLRSGNARGLKAEYFAAPGFKGTPKITRVETEINLNSPSFPSGLRPADGPYSVGWTGKLTPTRSGVHYIHFTSDGATRVLLDGKVVFATKPKPKKKASIVVGRPLSSYAMDEQVEKRAPATVMLEAGRSYDIALEYEAAKGDALAKLEWFPPRAEDAVARAAEMKIIRDSDLVVAVIGLQRVNEHENIDRIDIEIPNDQIEYMKQVARLNPNVVAVLINGSPLAIPWINENISSILEAWYPGEQGGNSIADVLFGDYNPAGRLPYTVYAGLDDLPAFDDYEVSKGRTYMYFDKAPMFPFGHGLSYTKFEYSNLRIDDRSPRPDGYVNVGLDVKNTGDRDGDEIIQLYARDVEASVKVPKKQLRGFRRVSLKKGEARSVDFRIAVGDLGFWDDKTRGFIVEPGDFEIQIGASSADIRLKGVFTVKKY